mmetsp:Transcript_40662/g.66762  ORF Transcript_40662/g.66762 Transcript_40662/m.66762 type:complete len:118 (+) Transcript_40662:178-531(+)
MAAMQQSVSRLEPSAFESIVRLCYAGLEACTEEQNYQSTYRLLTFTGGFCTTLVTSSSTNNNSVDSTTPTLPEQKAIYMTERIHIHPCLPIYACGRECCCFANRTNKIMNARMMQMF